MSLLSHRLSHTVLCTRSRVPYGFYRGYFCYATTVGRIFLVIRGLEFLITLFDREVHFSALVIGTSKHS